MARLSIDIFNNQFEMMRKYIEKCHQNARQFGKTSFFSLQSIVFVLNVEKIACVSNKLSTQQTTFLSNQKLPNRARAPNQLTGNEIDFFLYLIGNRRQLESTIEIHNEIVFFLPSLNRIDFWVAIPLAAPIFRLPLYKELLNPLVKIM